MHVIRVTVATFVTHARWVIIWKKIKRVAEVREREKLIFLLLIECNKACLKGCSGPGPEACAECAKGYKREEEGGPCEGKYTLFNCPSMYLPPPLSLFSSLDIDECDDEVTVADCSGGTYCINKPGSYQCESE